MICFRLLSIAVFCCYLHLTRSILLGLFNKIDMKLYTRRKPKEGKLISRNFNDIRSDFRGNLETWFIVHGYLSSSKTTWMHEMKDAALKKGDFNVIIVGWTGAKELFYPKAASNTRTVGEEIALVANNMIKQGGSHQSRLYCVGHSLGAHVCGHAGRRLKFGRITGLDPAGPGFRSCSPSCGLGPSSAYLVDVIHTDGDKFGMMKDLGHIDFYPNGGAHQPGCDNEIFQRLLTLDDFVSLENDTLVVHQRGDFFSCSHSRAIEYFTESLKKNCFLSRFKCRSFDDLSRCSLQTKAQSMGYAAKDLPASGIFYLKTNKKSPYCVG